MDEENVQDAVPQKPRHADVMRKARRDAEGLVGLTLILGPGIVTGLMGLPGGAPPYVMAAGTCLVLRSAAMTAAALRKRDPS